MSIQQVKKLFGMALDASDDPYTIQLKLAAMNAMGKGIEGLFVDPYDAFISELRDSIDSIEYVGKLSVPSWLTPIPNPSDSSLITRENLEAYVSNGGVSEQSNRVKNFVKERIFPGIPIMLGIDHSATGGVLSALSENLGSDSLGVLVLDQHFDGLPLSLRLEPRLIEKFNLPIGRRDTSPDIAEDESYCCGNFWKHLIDNNTVLPENLIFIGVADYPIGDVPPEWERFKNNYLDLEKRGCSFFPLNKFSGQYSDKLRHFIEEKIKTPNLYVSLDLDVGAYRCVHAARYMDREGIDKKALMTVAEIITDLFRTGRLQLAGMDIMEFNMHFLGIQVKPGEKDETLSVAIDFMKTLLS